MSHYLIVDAATSKNIASGAHTDVGVMVYLDNVLPVFTTLKALSEFARAEHPTEGPIWPTPLEVDPIRLATMAGELEGVERLVFDPEISVFGLWILQDDPWSVSSYRRYILELAHGTKRLFAEGRAKLAEEFSSPEELNKAVAAWAALQADKVDGDARARVKEWEIEEDSYGDEQGMATS